MLDAFADFYDENNRLIERGNSPKPLDHFAGLGTRRTVGSVWKRRNRQKRTLYMLDYFDAVISEAKGEPPYRYLTGPNELHGTRVLSKNGGPTKEIHSTVLRSFGLHKSDPYSFIQRAKRARGTEPTPATKDHVVTEDLVCKRCGMGFNYAEGGWPEPECPGIV